MGMAKKMMAKKSGMKRKMAMKKSSMKMRKMAMKKSIIAKGKRAKSSVFRGTKVKTAGGLKKSDLFKNKFGKVVSKKASAAAKKRKGYSKIAKWGKSVAQARKQLSIRGFCAVGGKSAQGKALLAKVKSLYRK